MFKRLFYILKQRAYVFLNKNAKLEGKVYMFHKVNNDCDTYSIKKDNFDEFIKYLINNKKIVSINEFIENKNQNNIIITFDDAFESVYENAFPILKKYNVPYYVFVCSEYLNKEYYLDKDMLDEMISNSKCIIGSHNEKHILSRFEKIENIRSSLKESKNKLRTLFNNEIDCFAFPYGSMYACSNKNIEDALKEYKYVFMTYPIGYNSKMGNIIPRINMNDNTFRKEMK